MKRILLSVLAGILLILGALALLVRLNSDKIGAAVSDMVEGATGRPLTLASGPRLSFFPGLGLTLGQAAWGNADDAASATLESATVTVALFPLLRGRVEIDDIRLGAPHITLNRDALKQGAPSPSAPASPAPDKPGSPQDRAVRLPAFSLARLEIDRGRLSIRDGATRTEIDDLALTATDVGLNRSGNITVQGSFLRRAEGDAAPDAPETPEAADPRIRFSLASDLFLDASSLRLTGATADLTAQGHTLALSLADTGGIAFSLATETLDIKDLALSLSRGATSLLAGRVSAAIRPKLPSGEASFQLEGSPRAALAACGVRLETRDATALTACSLSGKATLAGTELRLSALDARLDGTPLKGEATLAAPRNSHMSLTARLDAGQVNVDRYLPPKTTAATSDPDKADTAAVPAATRAPAVADSPAAAKVSWPRLDVRLAVQRLIVAGISLDSLLATLTGEAGAYSLRPCTFRLYEGAATLNAEARLASTPPRYGLNLNVEGVHLGGLLKDAAGTANVDGRIGLSANLAARGPAAAGESVDGAVRRSLNGKGHVTGANLSVRAGLIPSGAPAGVRQGGSFSFSRLNGAFTAVNGLVTLRDVALTGNGIDAAAAGTVSLPAETLDVTGTIRVGGIGVPVRVSGPLRAPSYAVDTRRLLQNTVEGILKGGGDTKEKARQTGNALKNLLGL